MKFRITLEKLSIINTFEKSQLPIDIKTDKNLVLELCKKGPCKKLKQKGKQYLSELYKTTYKLTSRFKLETQGKNYGESKKKPADSCSFVKQFNNANVNG